MLDLINHYYEVTDANKDLLKHLMDVEGIRFYDDSTINIDEYVTVGRVIGNNDPFDHNPKHTGIWTSKERLTASELQKLTTEPPKVLMTFE